MEPISASIVEKTWKAQARMNPSVINNVIQKFSERQPMMLAYLMAMGDNMLNENERELLLYLGTAVWQMMEKGGKQLRTVTESELENFEDQNFKMLEYLENEPDEDFNRTVGKIIEGYEQKEVLRYVVEALFEGEEEEDIPSIRKDFIGQIFIFLKIIIDCLDQ